MFVKQQAALVLHLLTQRNLLGLKFALISCRDFLLKSEFLKYTALRSVCSPILWYMCSLSMLHTLHMTLHSEPNPMWWKRIIKGVWYL